MNPATATTPTERPQRPPDFWDGVDHAFNPTGPVKVPPALTLSRDAATDIDPITYEVVRHGLWNANAEHVREIENLAVSQITVEIRDFQPCILTEDAELLYFGPCLQYMSGMLDMMTRYILENRGERVRDGDMWLCNDPIIGTAHQPDVGLICPVFVDGELFFASSNDLYTQFEYALDPVHVVIDMHASHLWDASTIAALDAITEKYHHHGKEVKITGLNQASTAMRERLGGKLSSGH